MKKIAAVLAVFTYFHLPEPNRFDLLIVTVLVYAVSVCVLNAAERSYKRMLAHRCRVNALRYKKPVMVDIKPVWPVLCIDGDYVLIETGKENG